MKHKAIYKTSLQKSIRLLLFTGVMASLCFSAAEGIRLLPFPVSIPEDRVETVAVNDYVPYSQTLREANNKALDHLEHLVRNLKSFKRVAFHHAAFPANPYSKHNAQTLVSLNSKLLQNFNSLLLITQCYGRAPPTSVIIRNL